MKKKLFFLLVSAFLLSGCAGNRLLNYQFQSEYNNPGLTQLIGKHISVVQDRVNLAHIDTSGLIYNYYYLYKHCDYMGDNVTYNGYGVILRRDPIYHCGSMFFSTDKDGIITNYSETGYIPTSDYQHYFKDIIVIER